MSSCLWFALCPSRDAQIVDDLSRAESVQVIRVDGVRITAWTSHNDLVLSGLAINNILAQVLLGKGGGEKIYTCEFIFLDQ